MGRLYQVRNSGTLVEQYTYDNNGNRLTGLDGGVASTGTYDAQHRLLTYGEWTFHYTDNGELKGKANGVTGQVWTYKYDVSGNLLRVGLPDGRNITYLHDGRNRRIAKMIDTVVVRRWVYGDQLNPVLELDGTGAPLFRYVYGAMKHSPDYVIDASGVTYRVLRDQLGSPLLIVNTTNVSNVMLNASYSAFGRRTVTSAASVIPTLGFAGGIYDEDTGLTRFGARDYDAVVGRWTAKDPILWNGRQANLYVYGRNDPANLQDPSGLSPLILVAGAFALAEAVAAYFIEREAARNAHEIFGDALWNNEGDAYKHCLASCLVAQERGEIQARVAGELNEVKGDCLKNQPPEERQMDEINNAIGRSFADGNCYTSCRDAASTELLQLSP